MSQGRKIINYGFSIVPDFHLSTRTAHMILRLSWLLSRPLLGACLLCVLRCATNYLLPTVSNQDYITVKEAFFKILGICIAQLQPSTLKYFVKALPHDCVHHEQVPFQSKARLMLPLRAQTYYTTQAPQA